MFRIKFGLGLPVSVSLPLYFLSPYRNALASFISTFNQMDIHLACVLVIIGVFLFLFFAFLLLLYYVGFVAYIFIRVSTEHNLVRTLYKPIFMFIRYLMHCAYAAEMNTNNVRKVVRSETKENAK